MSVVESPATAGKLSYFQLVALAEKAGLSHAKALTAAAIALAESGGRTDARGDVGLQDAVWGPSVGLWQIRSVKAQTGTGGPRDASRLTDPAFNARSMFTISGGGANWSPWTVFKTGAYKAYLGGGADTSSTRGDTSNDITPTGSAYGTGASAEENACLIRLPGADFKLGPISAGAGGWCLFPKSWGFALLGGMALVAGAVTMTVGVLVLASKGGTVKQAAMAAGTGGRSLVVAQLPAERNARRQYAEVEARVPGEQKAAAKRARTKSYAVGDPLDEEPF